MKIKTYKIEPLSQTEIQALAHDGEAAMLIEQLGLEGQKNVTSKTGTPFPYRVMTEEEQKVYTFHCPIHTKLEEYSSDFIPLRVLQVAAHAKALDVCNKGLWVWHPKEARLDPVLVGKASIPGQQRDEKLYLLARWGQVWKEFKQLLAEAKTGWIAKRKAAIKKADAEFTNLKTTSETDAELYFQGESVTTSIYF